jgi:hypothetical protein
MGFGSIRDLIKKFEKHHDAGQDKATTKRDKPKKTRKKRRNNKKKDKKPSGAVLLVDDEFQRVKDECYDAVQEIIHAGELFHDEEFDILNNPIGCIYGEQHQDDFSMKDFHTHDFAIIRLTQYFRPDVEIAMFKDGVTADDIVQGYNGTCWYLGALMCVALHNKFIKQLVVNYSVELGVYGIMFFVDGNWSYVIIDDYFPVAPNGILYNSIGKDLTELWIPLFEKAYAKLYGSYDMIDGGQAHMGIVDLTGGVPLLFAPEEWEFFYPMFKSGCSCVGAALKQSVLIMD